MLEPKKATALMGLLGHQFSDQKLLSLALTHRSKGASNYERLEFLGDSILGFVVADWLYKNFPKLAEGRLSRMRSSLVRKTTLARVARDLGLPDFLLLGEGELKSGGFNRDSILSDSVESLIGALYLDAGLAVAEGFIHARFEPYMQEVSGQSSFKDAKSSLQELMQKYGFDLPTYEILDVSGEQHEQVFTVRCSLQQLGLESKSVDLSRRTAEQAAANTILNELAALDLHHLRKTL